MRRETPSEPLLTFPWGGRPLSLWRLLPALLFSSLVLTSLAVVFKIKAPPPAPSQPLSQSILILDPSNPVNHIVLNRAQDRSALILGPEAIDEISPGSPLSPVFRPSFTGYELKLKPPYVSRSFSDHPRLFQPGDLALPSKPPAALQPPPNAASSRLGPKNWQLMPELHGSLAARPLRSLPDLALIRPQDLAKLRFQIAIKPNGRPLMIIPLHSGAEDRDIVPALQTALSRMVFAPAEGDMNEWGQISFTWNSAPRASP